MRAREFGGTWWGHRWIRALESVSATYPNPRLIRGRGLARRDAVRDLAVRPGEVTAQVTQGNRRHDVTLRLPVFTEPEWNAATYALSGRVRDAAALLEGRMPEDIDETLGGVGLSLFPRSSELTSTCTCTDTCTDGADPCAHAAAVHYVLAPMVDADPFLLPALRGRDRAALLAGLRAARSGQSEEPSPEGLFVAGRTSPARARRSDRDAAPAWPVPRLRRCGPRVAGGGGSGRRDPRLAAQHPMNGPFIG